MWRHFILPPCTTRGRRSSNVQFGSACAWVPVYYPVSPVVVVFVEDSPPFGDPGCALRHCPAHVLRSHPGVAPWLPHEGLANGEGERGHETFAIRRCARRAHSVNTVVMSKHELDHLFQLQLWESSHVLTGEPRGRRGVPSQKATITPRSTALSCGRYSHPICVRIPFLA